MSKVRVATIEAGTPRRVRLTAVTAGTAVPNARVRLASIEAGVPTGPLPGTYVWDGEQWRLGTLFVFTGEDVQEGPAPSGWRMATTT